MALPAVRPQEQHTALPLVREPVMTGPVPQQAPGGGCPWCNNLGVVVLDDKEIPRPHCQNKPAEDDRYDAAHPEDEHDGGLGSGDWLREREELRP